MKWPNLHPLAKSVFVVGGVSALTTGITLAVVSTQSTLAATTLSSTTAKLEIQTTKDKWGSKAPGFKIKNLVPGSGTSEPIYFMNAGGTNLQLSAHVPGRPVLTGFLGLNNVLISITGSSCGDTVQTNLAALLSNTPVVLPCGMLPAGDAGDPSVSGHLGNYSLHFDINQSAITGSKVSVSSFDIQFDGVQG